MLRHFALMGLCLLAPSLLAPSLHAQAPAGSTTGSATGTAAAAVPELSVRTLFHPDDHFDYFSSPPPSTLWTTDSRLVIERDESWQVMDPSSGEVEPWNLPDAIREQLEQISGLSAKGIEKAVQSAAQRVSTLDRPVMLEVGGGLAVIGGGKKPRLVTRDAASWDTPSLSPDGSAVAFVRENDLFVVQVESGESLRLTHDGSPTRLNGRLDWTYQEEIYGRGDFKGFWWSPDSQQIALLRIDVANVLTFTITESATPRGATHVTPYPKAGDPIPRAGLWVVALDTLQLTPIHQPTGDEAETLVVRVTWRPDGRHLAYQVQNRVQTWLELREADTSTSSRRVLLREEGSAWIEILGEPHWLPGGEFLWLSDLPAGRRHLWKISADGSRRTPVTSGDWDVRELTAVVPARNEAFVTGDRERGSRGQQLYAVRWSDAAGRDAAGRDAAAHDAALPLGEVTALTTAAGWHAVDVSPDGHWFTDTFSTLTREPEKSIVGIVEEVRRRLAPTPKKPDSTGSTPTEPAAADSATEKSNVARSGTTSDSGTTASGTTASGTTASGNAASGRGEAATGESVAGDAPSAEAPAPWKTLDLPEPEWVNFTTRDGIELPAYIIPPQGFDGDDSDRRYPVLVYTYGGPQAPAAVDRWGGRNLLYRQMLATLGIGVMVVDNRSSGGRGIADTWSIHRQFGTQELLDLLDAVAWLRKQPWVDGQRLAMRGWSFGGYYTAYAMTHSEAFAAGIAGGSVTDWRNYDAFYTERYMGLPQNNEAGYRQSSVTARASDLHGRLLLIHGEVDDNVHLSNTLQLVAALQRAGKQFDLMIYPGSQHGVTEAKQMYHLYELMTQFLVRELKPAAGG